MSIGEKIRGLPRVALIGFIAPLIALVCIVLAIAISPSFDWVTNALSDLGHYTRTDIGPNPLVRAIIFNFGLATTGVLLFIITLGFIKQINDWPTRIAMIPFLIACGFLTAIGVFSENFSPTHYIVSVGLFTTFPFAMWFVGLSWLRYRRLWWFCLVSLLLPFFSVYIWWGTFNGVVPWTGMAIPEILTALTAILWVWIFLTLEVKGKLSHLTTHSQ
ncbi:MAG: DUF998 domain-containing protein [Candidatus Thorarchaeota archaeon]|jgi:hypothetical membrane protein